ncbi:MAG: hypothetical protein EAZ39_10455 [Oscillatoriales cyanobacterium]|nr:MAG: hypothetical protein EAZ88_26315 [Oscillatoriales cyanobacterium]TAE65941.1 MAG: hypothetical protein EAZ86_22660 [Oscillatoriales cyanobacterium]TAF94716.1 MAG: hypothetical protein EAZ45_27015 [Oscillatoriales cyanobacterium]TAG18941.1 MAG: hypothetical protein EAZ39_10455 [Oscillatoriales cyanobacterium]TAG37953.1 MAG: hypothetical protein EAZ33_20875 [Oscillatoriales cyanobacterium]
MGHGAWGMGHGAWGMGHGALGNKNSWILNVDFLPIQLSGATFCSIPVSLLPLSDILVVCIFLFSDTGGGLHGS